MEGWGDGKLYFPLFKLAKLQRAPLASLSWQDEIYPLHVLVTAGKTDLTCSYVQT